MENKNIDPYQKAKEIMRYLADPKSDPKIKEVLKALIKLSPDQIKDLRDLIAG